MSIQIPEWLVLILVGLWLIGRICDTIAWHYKKKIAELEGATNEQA